MPTANTKKKTTKQPTFSADMVRTYLHEIGRVPLLTHEQEIVYGKQVQQMMALLEAKEALAEKLQREPTTKEWADQVNLDEGPEKNHNQGTRAKRKMIEANSAPCRRDRQEIPEAQYGISGLDPGRNFGLRARR
jgi:RNA polymerase nonessential primary-like sigma factor